MKIFPIHDFINRESEFFRILKFLPRIGNDGPWVAGGSVWKSMENIPLNCDVDFFFKDDGQYKNWMRTLQSIPYTYRIMSSKTNQYNTSFDFHINDGNFNKTVKIQCVNFKYFNNMEDLLGGFDFTACQFGFDGTNLHCGDRSMSDLKDRVIVFNTVRDLTASGVHLEKYTKLGFTVPATEMIRFEEIRNALNTAGKNLFDKMSVSGNPCVEEDLSSYPQPATRQSESFDPRGTFDALLMPSMNFVNSEIGDTATPSMPMDYVTSETSVGGETLSQAITREIDNEVVQLIQQRIDSQNTPGINIAEEFIGEPITESNRIETIRQEVESILTPSLAEYSRTLSDEEIISIRNGSRITTVENSTSSINSIER